MRVLKNFFKPHQAWDSADLSTPSGVKGDAGTAGLEADAAARVLVRRGAMNLGWPDGRIATAPELIRSEVDILSRHAPGRLPSVGTIGSRSPRRERGLSAGVHQRPAAVYEDRRRGSMWARDWICYYFINDAANRRVRDDCRRTTSGSAGAGVYASQFAPADAGAVPTRMTGRASVS